MALNRIQRIVRYCYHFVCSECGWSFSTNNHEEFSKADCSEKHRFPSEEKLEKIALWRSMENYGGIRNDKGWVFKYKNGNGFIVFKDVKKPKKIINEKRKVVLFVFPNDWKKGEKLAYFTLVVVRELKKALKRRWG